MWLGFPRPLAASFRGERSGCRTTQSGGIVASTSRGIGWVRGAMDLAFFQHRVGRERPRTEDSVEGHGDFSVLPWCGVTSMLGFVRK